MTQCRARKPATQSRRRTRAKPSRPGGRPLKLTPRSRAAFLDTLTRTVNVTLAARAAGISRQAAYQRREKDEAFAADWDNALEEGIDALEAEAHRRAFVGTDKPVFYKGEKVGTIREYSDVLTMFLLKAHRRDKYDPVIALRARVRKNDDGALDITVETARDRLLHALFGADEA